SGSSPDVAAVVKAARSDGAFTLALTNAPRSALARAADATFLLRCGRERAVAATKTYTASCLALAILASATAQARGGSGLSLAGIVDAVREAASREDDARRLARRIGKGERLVVLGRGYDYAAALEGALKIKELARVWAEPYSSADFAHGPRTLLERGTPVLLFASIGATLGEARRTVREVHARGARVYAITNDEGIAERSDDAVHARGARVYAITNDEGIAERSDDAVLLESAVSEALSPISLAVVAQHVAASVARQRGRDPERPAGLSKVTRTL